MDEQADKQSEQALDSALAYISKYLIAFFDHYSVKNVLTLSQTMQRVGKWDLKQWQAAINELEVDGWLPAAKDRTKVLGVKAGLSVGAMVNAIAGLAVVSLFSKQIKLINERVVADQSNEIDRMQRAFNAPKSMAKQAKTFVDKVRNEPLQPRYENDKSTVRKRPSDSLLKAKDLAAESRIPLDKSLWNDADKLINDLENMLLDNLKGDMTIEDLHRLTEQHTNHDQFEPRKNIHDRLRQQGYQVQRLIRTESARIKDRVNDYYYKQNGIKYVNWVCEPGACKDCLALSAAGPYLLEDAPRIPDDSHPNCRCGKVPATDINDRMIFDDTDEQTSTILE